METFLNQLAHPVQDSISLLGRMTSPSVTASLSRTLTYGVTKGRSSDFLEAILGEFALAAALLGHCWVTAGVLADLADSIVSQT